MSVPLRGKGFFRWRSLGDFCNNLSPLSPLPLQDLEYGLPVQVRDQALGVKDDLPKSDVGREYYLQNMEKELAITGKTEGRFGGEGAGPQ